METTQVFIGDTVRINYDICTIYTTSGISHSNEEQNTATYNNVDESH